MAMTTPAATNKAVAFKAKPVREVSGAAKKSAIRKVAKGAIKRGAISQKAAAKHLGDY